MGALTRTRGFRLESQKSAPDKSGPKTYTFKASDGEFDRDNDRISAKGWDLKAFNANPVILVNHDSWGLPVGKGKAYVEQDALMIDVQFDQHNDEVAKRVESKVEQGILSAVSVRFSAESEHAKRNEKGGIDFEKQELLEVSIVTIPANPRATRAKGIDDLVEALLERVKNINPDAGDRAPRPQFGDQKMDPEEIKKMQEALAAAQAKAADLEKAEAKRLADLETEKRVAAEVEKRVAEATKAMQNDTIDAAKGSRESPLPERAPVTGEKASKGSGIEATRFVKAQMFAKMNGSTARDVLKAWGYSDQAKALSQDAFSGMGSLVHEQWANDFIEYLRNVTCIRKAGPRTLQARGGAIRFSGQASTASAAYSGETTNIATSNLTTNEPLILSEKKLVALCPIPNDLIRNASIGAEQFVRDDLGQVLAVTEDSKFFYGTGASHEPTGLSLRIKTATSGAGAHKYAMTALTTAKKPLVGELKFELNKAIRICKGDNAPMRKPVWFMTPSTEAGIKNATAGVSPAGDGANMFEREMNEKGTLAGYPFVVTNQLSETLGTSCDFFLFDMDEVILAEFMGLEVETFPNGTYYNGSVAVSGISTDTSVVRAITKHDIGLRHNVSGIWVTGMTWGQP